MILIYTSFFANGAPRDMVSRLFLCFPPPIFRSVTGSCSLLFSDSLSNLVETVCADTGHGDKVVGGTETANGQVAAVLDGLVAAGGRHILRHFDGGELEEALECVL